LKEWEISLVTHVLVDRIKGKMSHLDVWMSMTQ